MAIWRWWLAWLAAVVVAAVLGSVVQTQLNLARIVALDGPVSLTDRVRVTLYDLGSFAPVWAVIMALALIVALPLAGMLARYLGSSRHSLHGLAGLIAVWAALAVMNLMMPVTPVAAARTVSGFLLLGLPGLLAGLTHAWLTVPAASGGGKDSKR